MEWQRALRWMLHRKWPDADGSHSEWDRRLGTCSMATIATTLALALSLHLILPALFTLYSERQFPTTTPLGIPLLSLLCSTVLIGLGAFQLGAACRRVGARSAPLFQLAHCVGGEAVAFAVAWSHLADQGALLALLCHALSEHTDLLFHNAIRHSLHFVIPSPNSTLLPSLKIDLFAVLMPLCVAVLLSCSTRVLVTMTMIFLIAALFTSASTTTVAFLHNIAHLRVFIMEIAGNTASLSSLTEEVFAGTRWFLLGWLCVETLSFLGDECARPHSQQHNLLCAMFSCIARVQALFSLVALLAFFPFLLRTMEPLPRAAGELPLPAMFNSVRLFSARYLMNVGSVCALWGALLCAFLPPTRLLVLMANLRLLPFANRWLAKLAVKGGQPRCAIWLVAACTSSCIAFLPKQSLNTLFPLIIVLRIGLQSLLLYLAHFNGSPNSAVIEDESGPKYRRVRRKQFLPGDRASSEQQEEGGDWEGGSLMNELDDSEEEDEESGAETEQRPGSGEKAMERIWRMTTSVDEQKSAEQLPPICWWRLGAVETPLLLQQPCQQHHHQCAASAACSSSMNVQSHNCLQHPCSSVLLLRDNGCPSIHLLTAAAASAFHVYELDAPVIAWDGGLRMRRETGSRAASHLDWPRVCKRAKTALWTTVFCAILFSIALAAIRRAVYMPILPLVTLFSSISMAAALLVWLSRLRVDNDTENWHGKESKLVPLSSMCSLFAITQLIPLFSYAEWTALAAHAVVGFIAYMVSVLKRMKEERRVIQ